MTSNTTEAVFEFTKIHQHDDRKQYKESWEKWTVEPEIVTMLEQEIWELKNKGYKGDIMDKMFKSSRYYYRNKDTLDKAVETFERQEYSRLSKQFLKEIDDYINSAIESNHQKVPPAKRFDDFCLNNKEIIYQEIQNMKQTTNPQSNMDANKIVQKIKKTFKNREYNIRNKLNK